MRATIARADLARTLTAVSRVIERRNTIPILSHVLLTLADDKLTARGTDLDIEMTVGCPATVEQHGTVSVDAGRLADIAKKAGSETVSLSAEKDSLVVKSGRSRFVLPTLPVDDFPSLAGANDYTHHFETDFGTLIAGTAFAVSTEETRFYLGGIYFHTSPDKQLVAVATDGHRLAKSTAALPDGASGMPGVIVGRKTVAVLAALKGTVGVSLSNRKIQIASGDTILTSKLIDGTFPDYQRVIPTGNDNAVRVDRAALQAAVDRVATVSDERGRAVKLEIADGLVSLSVSGADGSATDGVECTHDAPIVMGFNSRYLSELLAIAGGETVVLRLGDPGSPGLFTSDGNENWLGVCMPMRIG